MIKNVTYVDAAKFETLILASGLPMAPQAGFVKVSGAKGRNLYVARTKRVGRIDLSGFTLTIPGIVNLKDDSFGSVTQQLDFNRTEAEILKTFEAVLKALKALPPIEAKTRKAPVAKGPQPKGWTLPAPKAAVKPTKPTTAQVQISADK